MSISSLAAFADFCFLTAFLFWFAASESQRNIESVELPMAHVAVTPIPDFDSETQVLNIRWREGSELTMLEKSRYDALGIGYYSTREDPFMEITWEGEILMPPPDKWFSDQKWYDKHRAVYQTAKSWPRDSPVMIRADRSTPFFRITRFADVFNRPPLRSHDVFLAVGDGRD